MYNEEKEKLVSLVGQPAGLSLRPKGGVSFAKTTKKALFLSRMSEPNRR